jgi:hypothetical protein
MRRALRYLERLRWGDRFVCRFCGTIDGGWWQRADGLRRCAVCRRDTSVTAGTILAGTRTPLTSWFAAVWYVVNQKNGVSALGLQRVLGLGSYETAWAWLHKLRRAMVRPRPRASGRSRRGRRTLIGGVKPGRRGRGAEGKSLVGIAAGARAGGPSRGVSEDLCRHERTGVSCLRTRTAGSMRIASPASGDPAHVVLPHVHRVASLLCRVKRWLLGTHQGAVTFDQLDYYLAEFTFRFNR